MSDNLRVFGPRFVSIVDQLALHGRHRGEQVAIIDGEAMLSWRQLDRSVNRVANALLANGLDKGDRVALLAGNSAWSYVVLFGILRAGGAAVPLSPLLTPELLANLAVDADAKLLFTSDAFMELASSAFGQMPSLRVVAQGQQHEEFVSGIGDASPNVRLTADDLCNIIYSSGTTGTPKGIAHSHGARAAFGYHVLANLPFHSACRTLLATPPHTNGTWVMLFPTLLVGGTTILMSKFEPRSLFELIRLHRPTHGFLVPTMCRAILDHPDVGTADFTCFECALTAGAPMPEQMKIDVRKLTGDHLYELWGLTEGVGTVITPAEMTTRPQAVGRPIPGCDIRTIDDEGRENTGRGVGEIVGWSTGLMDGYWNRPETSKELEWTSADGQLFIRTGDMGEIDEEGYLTLRGRAKDMIISGGLNVFPIDIESVLLEHADVADVTVVGCPHEHWGETPVAFVIPREGFTVKPDELKDWANERLAKFQRLADVVFRNQDFPRNTLGKVIKNQMRDEYLER